jgi:hypothetical protein
MRIAALILVGLGVVLSLLNWACLIASWRSKQRMSPVFPAPSVFTALGLALLEETRPYWWLGLLTDYTVFGLLMTAPPMIAAAWRTSSFTRIKLLEAEDAPRRFELSLHRGGHFVLRARFEPAVPCDSHGGHINWFGAVGRWQDVLDGRVRLWGYRHERTLTLERTNTDFMSHEEHYPESREFPFDSLDGLRFRSVA